MELIKAIALLCQLHSGAAASLDLTRVEDIQKSCQVYFVKCLELDKNAYDLLKCIKERK